MFCCFQLGSKINEYSDMKTSCDGTETLGAGRPVGLLPNCEVLCFSARGETTFVPAHCRSVLRDPESRFLPKGHYYNVSVMITGCFDIPCLAPTFLSMKNL